MLYKLDRRVTFRRWSTIRNPQGGNIPVQVASWNKWATVEERSGAPNDERGQRVWVYSTRIICRYEKTRPTRSNDTIDYENERYEVRSVRVSSEGSKRWEIIEVEKIDNSINSTAPVTTDNIKILNYTGVTTETGFTNTALIGKTVFAAFKDGVQCEIKTSGSLSGDKKQVLFNNTTGQITYSWAFSTGEQATILYY